MTTTTSRGAYASQRPKAKPQDMQAASSVSSMSQKDVTSGGYVSNRHGETVAGGSKNATNPVESQSPKAKPQDMQAASSVSSMSQEDVSSISAMEFQHVYTSTPSNRRGGTATGGSKNATNPDEADADAANLDEADADAANLVFF